MTPQYEWDDPIFPKGADVFVGVRRRPGIVHSRSVSANGKVVYGIRLKIARDDVVALARRRYHEDVDCYAEAHDMESLLI